MKYSFFSLWRPLIGWIGVVALTISFVIAPIVKLYAAFYRPYATIQIIDVAPLIGILTTVLGMGSLRTIEKMNDVSDKH